MKGMEPEKPPNHERWIISYADFVTLLLATFVVMYAVSTINSSKFQMMAESFSTAFIGRTTHVQDTGFAAAQRAPFTAMPNPVHVPIITREVQVKNLPPALRQEETFGDPNQKQEQGKYLPGGGVAAQSQASGQGEQGVNAPSAALRQQVEQRVQSLDAAYDQLVKALTTLIGKGEVRVSLQPLGVVIDINEVLLFNSGKADLTPVRCPSSMRSQKSSSIYAIKYRSMGLPTTCRSITRNSGRTGICRQPAPSRWSSALAPRVSIRPCWLAPDSANIIRSPATAHPRARPRTGGFRSSSSHRWKAMIRRGLG